MATIITCYSMFRTLLLTSPIKIFSLHIRIGKLKWQKIIFHYPESSLSLLDKMLNKLI